MEKKTPGKILIIDDDPDIRTVVQILLKKQGYEVQTAAHKEEAVQKLDTFLPSVILMDVLLSGSDGRDLCRQLKGEDRTKDVSIIMCSAHPGAMDKFREYGADDFISKPFNAEVLLQKVQSQIESVQVKGIQ
jgi:DNA-binding response OmpR family regulator